jgi:hypothetical protein
VRFGEKEKTVFPMQFESGVVSKGENSRVGWPDKLSSVKHSGGRVSRRGTRYGRTSCLLPCSKHKKKLNFG